MDLNAFYGTLFQGDETPMMMDVTEFADNYYPGLSAIERKQTVLYGAAISATAAEAALVEVADAKDVDAVKSIFQKRIESQVGTDDAPGGAWYPETIRIWDECSRVVACGNCVMLIVSEDCDAIVSNFEALF